MGKSKNSHSVSHPTPISNTLTDWWISTIGKLQMIWCDHCSHTRPGNNYFGQNVPRCDSSYSLPHLIVGRLLGEVLRY